MIAKDHVNQDASSDRVRRPLNDSQLLGWGGWRGWLGWLASLSEAHPLAAQRNAGNGFSTYTKRNLNRYPSVHVSFQEVVLPGDRGRRFRVGLAFKVPIVGIFSKIRDSMASLHFLNGALKVR